jgi:outer membrane lipoprotein-sorting protein
MGVKGTIEIYTKAPNKMFTIQNIPGFGMITDGYDGQIAWSQDPSSGLRQKKGEELAQTKRFADFTGNVRTQYSKFELKGTEKVADKDAYVIVATPNEGKPETWFFDTQSGLMIRSDMTMISPMGEIPVKMFFEDYRDFEGMLMPYTTRQVATAFTAVIKIEEVKSNVTIDDAKFAMPKTQ